MAAAGHLVVLDLAGFSFAVRLILVIDSEAAVFESARDVDVLVAMFEVNGVHSQAVLRILIEALVEFFAHLV